MTSKQPVSAAPTGTSSAAAFRGTPVVPGVAHGPVPVAHTVIDPAAVRRFSEQQLSDEQAMEAYDAAVAVVSGRLAARAEQASGSAAEVLTATAGLARDPGLRSAVAGRVGSGGLVGALSDSVDQFAELFTNMGGLMAERVTDLRDLEKRLTAEIVGEPEPGVPTPDEPSVLVAEDLAPADTAGLDASRVLALVTERGGPTSGMTAGSTRSGVPRVTKPLAFSWL